MGGGRLGDDDNWYADFDNRAAPESGAEPVERSKRSWTYWVGPIAVVGGYFLLCVLVNGSLVGGLLAFGVAAVAIVVLGAVIVGLEALVGRGSGDAWWQKTMRWIGNQLDDE